MIDTMLSNVVVLKCNTNNIDLESSTDNRIHIISEHHYGWSYTLNGFSMHIYVLKRMHRYKRVSIVRVIRHL